jgi:hypothetical protein
MKGNRANELLNSINELFLSPTQLQKEEAKSLELSSTLTSMSELPFVIVQAGKKYLGYHPKLHKVWAHKEDWLCAISFEPILINTAEFLKEDKSAKPILIYLKNPDFKNKQINGVEIESETLIHIPPTTKKENIEKYEMHLDVLAKADKKELFMYQAASNSSLGFEIEKVRYSFWKV